MSDNLNTPATKYGFISNTNITQPRGGWDGLGAKTYSLLNEWFMGNVSLIEKIDPPVSLFSRVYSKGLRYLKLPATFPAFSSSRLNQIAGILHREKAESFDYLVFHGSTPWISYEAKQRYCAILDCSFHTYISLYHDMNKFSKRDIQRIKEREKRFFESAHRIFFTSQWGLDETCKHYNLRGENFVKIGQGPSTPVRESEPTFSSAKDQFLIIATDFLGKGGAEICEAFSLFVSQHPGYRLKIVGQKPPDRFLQKDNVDYLGYINKATDEGRVQLSTLYEESKALLMLTQKDIAPLVIIEAGLCGCVTAANNISAIGEMIADGNTGWIVPSNVDGILSIMKKIASMETDEMVRMRRNVYKLMTDKFSWKSIISRMVNEIQQNG